jgi:hypothetical protein
MYAWFDFHEEIGKNFKNNPQNLIYHLTSKTKGETKL